MKNVKELSNLYKISVKYLFSEKITACYCVKFNAFLVDNLFGDKIFY